MRHAKSDWSNADRVHDSERGLNKRGRRDAARVGLELRKRGLMTDKMKVFVSHARRARDTYALLKEASDVSVEETVLPAFYDACHHSVSAMMDAMRDDIQDVLSTGDTSGILLVGHNPGIEALLRFFVDDNSSGNWGDLTLTTSNVAIMRQPRHLARRGWEAPHSYRLEMLIRPREL